MSDIAQLGLAIDSRQVTTANAALDQLATKSGAAAAGADKLAASGAKSATVMRAIEAAAKREGVSVADMTARVDRANASHAKMAAAAGTAAIGITTLANAAAGSGGGGSSGGSLAGASDKSSSALERLGNTLTRRVLFAFVAKEARDLAAYIWNLNSAIAATADSAMRSGMGGGNFQGLQTAAAYKGVSNSDFNGAMVAFNQQVDHAKHGLGDLKTLLSANGKTVGDTATTFGIIADLVKNAGSEAQKFSILQQAGLPASAAFVKYMEQGSAAINMQSAAAKKLSGQQLEDAKRVDAAWQQSWTDFENWGKRAIVNVAGWLTSSAGGFNAAMGGVALETVNRGKGLNALKSGVGSVIGKDDVDGLYNGNLGFGTVNKPGSTEDNAQKKLLLQQDNQRLAQLGELASVTQIVTQKQNELNIAGRSGYGISTEQQKAVLNLTAAQAENARVTAQAAIGVFSFKDASKAAADTLQSWIDRRLLDPNNPTQYAAALTVLQKQIEQTGNTAQIAAAPLEGLKRLELEAGSVRTQLDQFAVTSTNQVTPALRDMLLSTTSLSAGFKSLGMVIVQALTDAIIKLTIIKPLLAGLGLGGGGGGFLGMLGIGGFGGGGAAAQAASASTLANNTGGAFFGPGFHSGMGPGDAPTFMRSVPASTFANAPRFHSGIGPGEQAAIIRTDESVLTPGQMRQLSPRGGSQPVNVTYAPVYQLTGTAEEIEKIKRAAANDRAEFASNVVTTIKRAQAGRHL